MTRTYWQFLLAALCLVSALACQAPGADKINVLIVDGQNNHNWKGTTPVIKDMLLKTGRFNVEVLTSPSNKDSKDAWDGFRPDFSKYGVVFSNYNGQEWPAEVKQAFEKYMNDGGGLVIYHAANNSFTGWTEWAKMIGLLWKGPEYGDRITVDDGGKVVRTPKGQGPGAGHGRQHPYEVVVRDREHPVTKGMSEKWTHPADELYHGQRGPALNMHILVTAFSDKSTGGTGEHEAMVYTVTYGKGRVFVNLLGHDAKQTAAPGCAALMCRGTEWAATLKATVPLPKELSGEAPSPTPTPTDEADKGQESQKDQTPQEGEKSEKGKKWTLLIQGGDFTLWRKPTNEWQTVGEVCTDPRNEKLLASKPGSGVIVNGAKGRTSNILTGAEFGDIETHVEFMVPKDSNSGVYFMARYEIQVFDSWGVEKPKYSDCGGIYERWGPNGGYEGHAPGVNASLPPGQWQTYDVIFQAPRFDADGKKTANAKFIKVVHNGKVIHENVEVTGPTRASTFNDEKPTGPLMFQGDHGPVAYRNLKVRPLKTATAGEK